MESLFCFEIAVDKVKLRKRIKCSLPYIAVAFLDFPTILIHLNSTIPSGDNEYLFEKGKSCLFKISTTELFERLKSNHVYVIILDQLAEEQTCVGSSSFDLSHVMKDIVTDIQTNGLHRTTCHGATETIHITNFMHDSVGNIDLSYKLTSLGHSMLPHLQAVSVNHNPTRPAVTAIQRKQNSLSSIENVVCPPALFYTSKKPNNKEDDEIFGKELQGEEDSEKRSKIAHKRRDHLKGEVKSEKMFHQSDSAVKENCFISVRSTLGQKCEATQTDAKPTDEYPLLKALVEEVLKLGLNSSFSSPDQGKVLKSEQNQLSARSQKKTLHLTKTHNHQTIGTSSSLVQKSSHDNPKKKSHRYPLKYGLTKSLLLRMEMNQKAQHQPVRKHSSHIPKKKFQKQKPVAFSEERHMLEDKTYTKPIVLKSENISPTVAGKEPVESVSDPDVSAHFSLDDQNYPSANDVAVSLDTGSPRAQSRQSIEIRLPTATSSYSGDQMEDLSDKYKYSDDFDQASWDRSASALTTLETSPQNTAVDASVDVTGADPQLKISVDVSPDPTTEVSLSPPLGATYQKTSPTALQLSSNLVSADDEEKLSTEISAEYISPTQPGADEEKPTDNSSSLASTPITSRLPVPPPSDSPVIRSLVSEPTLKSKKPHPPVVSVSHSSSYERIRRKFRRSSESSFHLSGLSDLRTSDLADIKTSDISELRSSDDGFTSYVPTSRFLHSSGAGDPNN